MPKASSSSSSRPSLRRNQACLSCRKRKLKCDAARPHCGTCVKQWQAVVSVPPPPGYAHPTEPQCSYDPVEGLPLAPDVDPLDKIRDLEEQITHLRKKLKGSRRSSSPSRSASPNLLTPPMNHPRTFSTSSSPPMKFSPPGPYSPDFDRNTNGTHTTAGIALPQASLDLSGMSTKRTAHSESPELRAHAVFPGRRGEEMHSLLYLGWNPDLPEPSVLEHYVEVFFRCDPCGSRVLHRPSFMASLRLPPTSPDFPHPAILHAICASASRWASQSFMTLPDGARRDRFAEYHANKTRQYIDRTMASGDDIFSVMQACGLLSWYFYAEGRWVEVWIFAGFQTRVAVPLRLNYPNTYASHNSGSPGAYLPPPKDQQDLELRRRTWWMTVLFDRIVSVGGWVHGVDERDIGTELPLRGIDFETNQIMPDNPQDLTTLNVFTQHPSQYTDSFILLIKAMMLFGRVTDFGVRANLRATALHPEAQNPFRLPGFEELDRLTSVDFLAHIPQRYKISLGDQDTLYGGGGLDTDLYMVSLVPHAAAITLHNPYIDFGDSQCVSTARCISAARAILTQHYALTATSFDITRLHPFATICWYLAAVVQVQICKHFIEIGATDREYAVWGEINVLRFAMTEYGKRSPIGTRQEKLLQGLMTEIVRMTTQQQPLEVGIPLYPFSHAGVFNKAASGGDDDVVQSHVAPLPVSPSYDDELSPVAAHGPLPPIPPTMIVSPSEGSPWVLNDVSQRPYTQ